MIAAVHLLAQTTPAATAASNDEAYLLWGFILLGIAVFLLLLELFVPSGGMIGLLCGVAAIASVVAFYRADPWYGLLAALTYIVVTPFLLVFIYKLWLHSPMARSIILGAKDEPPAESDEQVQDLTERRRQERFAKLRQLIGADGVSVTPLRPVGVVKINNERIDALAEHGIIPENTAVTVVDVYDNQIKVRQKPRINS
jgi:membrane-bound ClpP family serine protease